MKFKTIYNAQLHLTFLAFILLKDNSWETKGEEREGEFLILFIYFLATGLGLSSLF